MTPQALLEEVKARFMVLLHDDETRLNRLLRQALGKYQEKAGVLRETAIHGPDASPMPKDFLDMASVRDSGGRFVPHTIIEVQGAPPDIALTVDASHVAPFKAYYFSNLKGLELDEPIPQYSELIADYLEALIAVPNAERQRTAYAATGLSPADIPSYQELKARIDEVERYMEDNKAFLPPCLIT